MDRALKTFLIITVMVFSVSCGGDNLKLPSKPDPESPSKPDSSSDPIDPNAIYNGIVLPSQWPPIRNYVNEVRTGMSPFYLNSKPAVLRINVGRQLFVDDFLISSTSLTRKYHYPEYHSANPVLIPDQAWEKQGSKGGFAAPFSDGVWYDEKDGKFKMWYMAGGGTYATSSAGITCYAESDDGIVWRKPALNVVPGTNIVRFGSIRDASTVWLDKQETDASSRYKMFEVSGGAGKWAYHYLTSSDGKVWRDNVTPSDNVADRSTVYHNPFRSVWVWSMRHNVRVHSGDPYTIRCRDYMEHKNPATGNKAAKADLKNFWFGPWPEEQRHPYYNNNDGSPGIYNLDATPYESIMLGFFSVWQGPENDVCSRDGVIKRNQIMLGYSRDGYSWFREDMNPFLAVDGNVTAWNNANLQSAAGSPIIVNDTLYFYLSGRRLVDGNEITTTGLATIRRDGFVSMSGNGELLTEPFCFKGEHLFVNVNARGQLLVEVVDKDGKTIEGFSKGDCLAIKTDNTRQAVVWKNKKTMAELGDQVIRLRFYLIDSDLYSFWISDKETGESHGYTAGGGPGLNQSGIDE